MAFARPTLTDLITRVETDLTTRLVLAGAVLRRSVVAVFARVQAAATHGLYGYIAYLALQLFEDTAEVTFLERRAGIFGLTRLAATFAAGTATATGVNGTVIVAGTKLQRADGAQYTTQADVTIVLGTATVSLVADVAGIAGNAIATTALSFVSPVPGLAATATVAGGGLTAGTDTETDDGLRTRLLSRLQAPPHGGAAADYVAWALSVAGVTRAWSYALELGAGTVTVRFVRDNDGTGTAIIPDAGEVTAVQAAIDAVRPVTAAVTVVAPIADVLNFTIHVIPDNSSTRAAILTELTNLLMAESTPGSTLLLSHIRASVSAAAGVTDFSMTVPAADVTHATGHIATMGTITWS